MDADDNLLLFPLWQVLYEFCGKPFTQRGYIKYQISYKYTFLLYCS